MISLSRPERAANLQPGRLDGVDVARAVVSGHQSNGLIALDDAVFADGNAGAPVVGQYGKVVGMIFRKASNGRGWALSSHQIVAALADLGEVTD